MDKKDLCFDPYEFEIGKVSLSVSMLRICGVDIPQYYFIATNCNTEFNIQINNTIEYTQQCLALQVLISKKQISCSMGFHFQVPWAVTGQNVDEPYRFTTVVVKLCILVGATNFKLP